MKNGLNGSDGIFSVADGVWGMKHVFVNFYMIQSEADDSWVLVDAGLKWSAPKIKKMAATLFGQDSRPKAIILTHGHFDHVGSVSALAEEWDVPVYAHFMEIPYLTGKSSYPPPDPTVGGGLMATMSFVYPKTPINIWSRINVLPPDGSLPVISDWKYIHTPGHTPGHISLFRESDKVLIAGDAFVTTKAESAISVMLQTKKISGPPKYFTYDWTASENSVKTLFELQPKIAATGHGQPMQGAELRDELLDLTQHFESIAVPEHGRYVNEPAVADTNGVIYIPRPVDTSNNNSLIVKTAAITAGLVVALLIRKKKEKKKKEHQYLLDFEYNF
jgi:glyoxylase-like metal-dependent hydrolase (beta-lactamase superfamily II)